MQYNKVVPAVNQIETNLFSQQTQCREWMEKFFGKQSDQRSSGACSTWATPPSDRANVFANAIKHDYKSKNPTTRWSDIIVLK